MEWSFDGIVDALYDVRTLGLVAALTASIGRRTTGSALTWLNTLSAATLLLTVVLLLSRYIEGQRNKAFPWRSQIVLVTGSSGGLGKALVQELKRKRCAKIICVDLHQADGQSDADANIIFERCDLGAERATVEEALRRMRGKHGDVTVLISNAAIMVGKPLLELNEEQFERTITVNLLATHRCLRVFLPAMLERKAGHIVATASIMSYFGVSELGDYVASKHALAGLMESLRFELDWVYKLPTVRTTLLVLGQLRTPLFERVKVKALPAFLMPLQDPIVIAKDVVRAIEQDRSQFIYRPHLARFAAALPALPAWLRNAVHDFSGANRAFHGGG
jgi:NAD(P)-dependent dehydrogenase (short-subunit alcohol dehydrogenase family)